MLMATGIPPIMPLRLVSGVLKSPWASIHIRPTFLGPCLVLWCPASIPIKPLQLASSPRGVLPSSSCSETMLARCLLASAKRFLAP